MRVITFVLRGINRLNDWIGKILSWSLLGLIVLLVYAVVMRYGFGIAVEWAHESSLFIYGGLAILTGAYLLSHKGHINMGFFYDHISLRKRAIVDCATAPLFFLVIIVLIWTGWEGTIRAIAVHQVSASMWEPIIWPIKATIPVGGFLLLVQGAADFSRNLYLAVWGRELR